MSIVNILDSSGAYTLDSANSLDLLIAGGRRVVITDQVFLEIERNPNTQLRSRILSWIADNAQHIDSIDTDLSAADFAKYGIDLGDASIAKYIEELSDQSQHDGVKLKRNTCRHQLEPVRPV